MSLTKKQIREGKVEELESIYYSKDSILQRRTIKLMAELLIEHLGETEK